MGRMQPHWHVGRLSAAALIGLGVGLAGPPQPVDPFDFFRPTVEIRRDERLRLDRGEVVVRALPGESGEIAVFAAVRTVANGARLVKWIREIAALKRSSYVTAISRFSTPPRREDVGMLEIPRDDLEAIRTCRPGSCELKLTSAEMASLQAAARSAGDAWRPALQEAFRTLVLDRVSRYLTDGHAALAPYADRGRPTGLQQAFALVMQHSPFLTAHEPELADYLANYPNARASTVESFAYWSLERLGGRPSVTATHVAIVQPRSTEAPETLVAGKQIFATHYVNASLNITAILRGRGPSDRYLVVLNRSRLDLLDRWYAGLARALIERRIKNEAAEVFRGLRDRLESGDPPASPPRSAR